MNEENSWIETNPAHTEGYDFTTNSTELVIKQDELWD